MQATTIAVIPGDGIGKEVCAAAVDVLTTATKGSVDLKTTSA